MVTKISSIIYLSVLFKKYTLIFALSVYPILLWKMGLYYFSICYDMIHYCIPVLKVHHAPNICGYYPQIVTYCVMHSMSTISDHIVQYLQDEVHILKWRIDL